MTLMNVKDYFDFDTTRHRYSVPLGFLQMLKFDFIRLFFINLPFSDRVFIDSDAGLNYYFTTILKVINSKIPIRIAEKTIVYESRKYTNAFSVLSRSDEYKHRKGYGCDFDYEVAVSKAIGEFLERYFCSNVGTVEKETKTITWADAINRAVIQDDYHVSNSDKSKIQPDTKVSVTKVEDMVNKSFKNYPAQYVLWGSNKFFENDVTLHSTTSGCGAGFSLEEATLSAFYELIERDAFMCHWLTRSAAKRVVFREGEHELFDYWSKSLKEVGLEVLVLNTTTNVNVFSCVCVVLDNLGKRMYLTGGCNIDPMKAINSAIKESIICIGSIKDGNFDNYYTYEEYKNKEPFSDQKMDRSARLSFWAKDAPLEEVDFLLNTEGEDFAKIIKDHSMRFSDSNSELLYLIDLFKSMGCGFENIYRYNFKDSLLEDLDYFVVRIIIPKLYPLYLTESFAYTNSKRLEEFNLFKNGTSRFDINILPHPFP